MNHWGVIVDVVTSRVSDQQSERRGFQEERESPGVRGAVVPVGDQRAK